MKRFTAATLFLLLPALAFCEGQSSKTLDNITKQFTPKAQKVFDILEEDDDIKTLALEYDNAPEREKPSLKKEVRAKALAEEELAIKKTEQRLERQEQKIKELKQNLAERKKQKQKTADLRAEDILSPSSLQKLRENVPAQTAVKKKAAKIKSKAKTAKAKEEKATASKETAEDKTLREVK